VRASLAVSAQGFVAQRRRPRLTGSLVPIQMGILQILCACV
jgi:hypothetical protein